MITSNKLYDILKYWALIVLPAVGTLYFALSQIWGLSGGAEVVGSITAFDTFLGLALHISKTQYNNSEAKYDGVIDVIDTPDKKTFSMTLHGDPNNIDKQSQVIFKVNTAS